MYLLLLLEQKSNYSSYYSCNTGDIGSNDSVVFFLHLNETYKRNK